MPPRMRVLVALSIVTMSAAAGAQPVDPWADEPTSDAAPPPEPPPPGAPLPEPPPPPAPPAHERRPPPPRPLLVPRDLAPKQAVPDPATTPATLHMRHVPLATHGPDTPRRTDRVVREPRARAPGDVDAPAAPPRTYPFELVDRPLVLPAGVTEFGASYQRRSFVDARPTMYGGPTSERASSRTPDFNLAHAFSRAELGIGIGQLLYGWVAIATRDVPERVHINLNFSAPQPDGRYYHSQMLGAAHRLWTEQGRASLVASAGLQLVEMQRHTESRYNVSGEFIATGGDLILQVQAQSRLAFRFSLGAAVPLAGGAELDVHATIGGGAGLLIAFESWDLVASGGVTDITSDVVTFLSAGFRKRWGL